MNIIKMNKQKLLVQCSNLLLIDKSRHRKVHWTIRLCAEVQKRKEYEKVQFI